MFVFEVIVMKLMLIVTVMLNLLKLRVRSINSYLIEANTISCRIAHLSQTLCMIFNDLQLFSIDFSYVRMLTSSTNLRLNTAMSSLLIIFNKSAL
jgi:hypothetical protein